MIHSESGGILSFDEANDIAKVQVLEGSQKDAIFWCVVPVDIMVEAGDVVLVLCDNTKEKAKILRIDESVPRKNMPFTVKQIIRKIK